MKFKSLDPICQKIVEETRRGLPLPPEVEGRIFQFRCFDPRDQYYGWSIEGQLIDVIHVNTAIDLDTVFKYYSIQDARRYKPLMRGQPYLRFVLRHSSGLLSVIVYNYRSIHMSCVS